MGDDDTSSSEEEEVLLTRAELDNLSKPKTEEREIHINPALINQIKLTKRQLKELDVLQRRELGIKLPTKKPIDPLLLKEREEKKLLQKLLKEEKERMEAIKNTYITLKVPAVKKRAKKVPSEKEQIEADDEDTEKEDVKPPRRRRFQREKVELDTSDEERVAKLESIDQVLNQYPFATRGRRRW